MIRVFQSASASERLTQARRYIDELAASKETVIVGSSRASVDDFARLLAKERVATKGIHRFSLVQLAFQIAREELARRDLAPVTATGAVALGLRSAFEVRRSSGFVFFDPVADKPGFASALANTIRELRESGVDPFALAALGKRGQDLAALLTEYVCQLNAGNVADRVNIFQIASEQIEAGYAKLSQHPILLLDLAIVSKAERNFIAALGAKSPAIFATVVDGDVRTSEAFAAITNDCVFGAARSATSLDRLQHHIFRSIPDSIHPEDGKVEFFSAPGEGRECVEIARRIQEASRAGVAFDEMAVALRSPGTYAPLLEAALERAGVGAYFAYGVHRPHASGRALIALLLCAEEGLSAKRFAEYLSLGQVPDLEATGAPPQPKDEWEPANDEISAQDSNSASTQSSEPPPPDAQEDDAMVSGALRAPWKWEKLLIEASVVGGLDRWERRLKGLSAEIELKIASIKLDEPDSPQVMRLARDRANLEHLRRFALPLLEVLSTAPKEATWAGWLTFLQQLVTMALRHPKHVLAVLTELQPISAVGPVSLSEVREALSERLTKLSVEPPRSRYGSVFIGTAEQLRGRTFKIVFVPGLAERIFPQKHREDPLLLDGDRQRLHDADPLLVTLADRVAEERLLLRIMAGAAQERIFFSYPRMEVALARPRVPSFYALDIGRSVLGRLPNVEEFEHNAAKNSGAELAWHAPENPSDAIDDIEYDLSVLRPLLNADPKSVHGQARFLMELSPELGRSLRTRWQRWQKNWGSADGLCATSDLAKEQLAKYRLNVRAYSPTSLQSFASCPYKFLLSAIHKLGPREESIAIEEMDPLIRGHMYHAVAAKFLRAALSEKMLPITKANLSKAHSMMDNILTATEVEYHEQYAPAFDRVWHDDAELLRADLRGWLTQMSERSDGYIPELIEFSFGLPADNGRDPASTPHCAILPEGFLVHGIVDLAEKNQNGDRRITDYKTGKNSTEDGMVVGRGEVLQPVLYSLSIESVRKTVVKEAQLSFCTAKGGYTERTVVMDTNSRQIATDLLRTIDESIGAGFLPAAPKKDGCKWCGFTQVCGPHEEIRVGRKNQAQLTQLVRIRETL